MHQGYENETWQNDRLSCTYFTLYMPLIGHVTNIYGLISTSTSPIETKLDRMIDEDVLNLICT